MKNLRISYLLLVSIIIFSCKKDDEDNNQSNNIDNHFTYNGDSYELKSLFIIDENTENNDPSDIGFQFSNKTNSEIINGNDLTDITQVYFDFNGINVQETSYTNLLDFGISIDGNISKGNFTEGTFLLSDNDPNSDIFASNTKLIVNSITDNTIDLNFTFNRNDGKIISGSYNGNYSIPTSD